MKEVTTDKLVEDLQLVINDAEELLKATAGQAGEKLEAARARARASVDAAKASVSATGVRIGERSREVARATDECVHENPWSAIGVAAGFGMLLGFLIGRK